jgi:DNA-binding response OmpR family regulator
VDIAANGDVAERMLEAKEYDLILMDIRMPVVNGKQLYQSILRKHPGRARRVIFTSGDTLSGDTKSFLEQSGRLCLPKPFSPDELEAVVKEALGRIGK